MEKQRLVCNLWWSFRFDNRLRKLYLFFCVFLLKWRNMLTSKFKSHLMSWDRKCHQSYFHASSNFYSQRGWSGFCRKVIFWNTLRKVLLIDMFSHCLSDNSLKENNSTCYCCILPWLSFFFQPSELLAPWLTSSILFPSSHIIFIPHPRSARLGSAWLAITIRPWGGSDIISGRDHLNGCCNSQRS